MSAARKAAEEALATMNGVLLAWGPQPPMSKAATLCHAISVGTLAIEALLAEQTEAGGELISCPACNLVVGRTDAPAPSPARDEVREAAEEWAAAEAEYDAVPAYSRDTDAFARNMSRRQSARRRLLAALSRDAKGGEK